MRIIYCYCIIKISEYYVHNGYISFINYFLGNIIFDTYIYTYPEQKYQLW